MKKIIYFCGYTLTLFVFCSLISYAAQSLNFYEAPNVNSKVVGALDPQIGFIPIFILNNSDWIKIADPRNGKVGWIETKKATTGFSLQIIRSTPEGNRFQLMQYSSANPTSPSRQEIGQIMQQTQFQQQQIQKELNKIQQQIYNQINQPWTNVPPIAPIIVIPKNAANTPNAAPAPTKK